MKIGIIGQGFVGSAIREGLKNFYKVNTYDLNPEKCNTTHEEVCKESNIIFMCLPTPMRRDGSCDTRILEKAIQDVDETCIKTNRQSSRPILVIKSTVIPGTTARIGKNFLNREDGNPDMPVCFSPEFLTEANSFDDFKNQSRIVIGGPRPATGTIKQMFRKAFPTIPIIKTGTKTAEMVKYFTNCFLATKVTFANQMYQICLDSNIDYDKVCEYILHDARIGKSHLSVPGPDGDLGFGGHCFPKDLAAMIAFGSANDGDTSFLKSVQEFNDKVRMIRDWELMQGRAVSDD